jgi:hypothetical protein
MKLRTHLPRNIGTKNSAKSHISVAVIKAVGHLAVVLVDKIAFAESATGEELNGVDSTHIRFNDSHEIALATRAQLLKDQFGHPYAYGQTRT